ncbi:FAS1 domain-containing protein [Rickenella mellea]|uniref:FAS1 domain-containing protein n=1 Tax=Rickenella mellea TaxID=50990 RepID=A0A4Y7QL19_9AGAM|nr:FAS1 domain-containing protein [Rickenella mellea]
MHLSLTIPLTLLISLPLVASSQLSFNLPHPSRATTIIDFLSADKDYTSLLKLLQLARLIPTVNKLNGSTLFAPTNDAIERHSLWRAWVADTIIQDNVHEQLRQELLYHMLNYSLPVFSAEQELQTHMTLLYPRKPLDPPSREPPPGPPWMPIPGGTLGGQPQRVRLSTRGEQGIWVGVDAMGEGGANVVKGQVDAGNGILLGIGDVLQVPPDLATIVSRHPSLTYLNNILKPSVIDILNNTSESTIFLPVDSAWETLDPIERLYLESEFASDDVLSILNMHSVHAKGVHWSDSFWPSRNLTTVWGHKLEIVVGEDKTLVSGAELIEPDVYASNGVLHTVSNLLIPPGALQLTPEKYLLALNCTSFVSLLHSVDLTWLINSTETQYTILAPNDDVLELFGGDDLPEKGTDQLRKLLSYHFIPGKWSVENLKDKMLLETALVEEGLDGGRQVLEVEVTSEDGKKKKDRSVRFGDVGVIGDHVEVDNTLIYFLSRPLVPPSDPLTTALPSLDMSSFLAAVFSTSLAEVLKQTPRTTFLIPRNSAFKRLGLLVSAHLLSVSSKTDLENVISHHVLDGVEYARSFTNSSKQTFATLDGSDVRFTRHSNGTLNVSPSGGWPGMHSIVTPRNILTQTGVIHELSDIILPRSVELTVGKLVKAARGNTMATVITRAGMDWILNGTAPPDGSPWADAGMDGAGWTLLCPTDEAFNGYNLTRLYSDVEALREMVQQHLIPMPDTSSVPVRAEDDPLRTNSPIPLEDSATYTTLESRNSAYGDIVFRSAAEDGKSGSIYLVGIKNARGTEGKQDWARVLAWGRSTTGGGSGGVIQIDQLLVPYRPPFWYEYGAPVATGIGGVILICLFFLGVRAIWRRDTTEATYEPVGGYGEDD